MNTKTICNKTRGNFSNANHLLALGGIFLICLVLLQGDVWAFELYIYAEWAINDHVTITPLVGFYDPEKSAEEGGIQLGSSDTSLYAQATMVVSF